jgi:N4-gp56 family major capsid protein
MATTAIATTHGLTVEQWNSNLFREYQEKTFFGRFKGTDVNSMVQVKRDLQKKDGDAVTFALSGILSGAGVAGNNVLGTGDTSNEEAMSFYNQRVVIDQIRNGTRLAGKMDEKRPAFSLREAAKVQLTDWMAYNEDAALFTAVNTADVVDISAAHVAAGGTTAKFDSLDTIPIMKQEAMFPSGATRKIRPIKIENGEEVFVIGLNPADALTLKQTTDWKSINQNADLRGKTNKLFTGSLGMYDGCIIHEHSNFVAGSPVLMGAQALFLCYGDEIMYGEEEFDYGNQNGFMIGSVRGVALAKFLDQVPASQGSHGALVYDIAV